MLKGGGAAHVSGFLRQHAIPARLAEAVAAEVGVAQKQVILLGIQTSKNPLLSLLTPTLFVITEPYEYFA